MVEGPDAGEIPAVDLDKYRPSFNASPGSYFPVVTKQKSKEGEHGEVEKIPILHCMKWGLVPSFTKKTEKPDHYRMVRCSFSSLLSELLKITAFLWIIRLTMYISSGK